MVCTAEVRRELAGRVDQLPSVVSGWSGWIGGRRLGLSVRGQPVIESWSSYQASRLGGAKSFSALWAAEQPSAR